MRRVYLIGCGKQKLLVSALAREIYTGGLFRYAEAAKRCEPAEWATKIYVLSAKHALLELNCQIAPYDRALPDLSEAEQHNWGIDVVDDLVSDGWMQADVEMVVLAGAPYVDALKREIERRTHPASASRPRVVTPLAGLGIGKRLAWLTNETNRLNAG